MINLGNTVTFTHDSYKCKGTVIGVITDDICKFANNCFTTDVEIQITEVINLTVEQALGDISKLPKGIVTKNLYQVTKL